MKNIIKNSLLMVALSSLLLSSAQANGEYSPLLNSAIKVAGNVTGVGIISAVALAIGVGSENIQNFANNQFNSYGLFNSEVRALNHISDQLLYLLEKTNTDTKTGEYSDIIFDLAPLQHMKGQEVYSIEQMKTLQQLQQEIIEQLNALNSMISLRATEPVNILEKNLLCLQALKNVNKLRSQLGYARGILMSSYMQSYVDISLGFKLKKWFKSIGKDYGLLLIKGTGVALGALYGLSGINEVLSQVKK